MDIEAYVPGKSAAHGGGQGPQAVVQREPARRLAEGDRGGARGRRQARILSRRLGDAAARGDRRGAWAEPGQHRLLQRLGRDPRPARADLSSPGDEAIFTEHGFLVYKIYIQAAGAVPVSVRETEERADVDAILAAVTAKTKIVFLANPNNPTGTYLPFEEIRRLHAGLPKHVLLVLDAAYAEYVRRNDYEAGIELVVGAQNVVMTRTFSKIHGLGGAAHRLDVCAGAYRRRDQPHARAVQRQRCGDRGRRRRAEATAPMSSAPSRTTTDGCRWLTDELPKLGLRVTPSVGNFVLIHFPDDEKHSAAEADAFLSARGYILRRVTGYGFPNALRMTVGTEEANRGVVAALAEFLKS